MLEPRKNWIIFKFFSWYINRIIKSDFQELKFNKISIDQEQVDSVNSQSLFLVGWICSFSNQPSLFQKKFSCDDHPGKLSKGLVHEVPWQFFSKKKFKEHN